MLGQDNAKGFHQESCYRTGLKGQHCLNQMIKMVGIACQPNHTVGAIVARVLDLRDHRQCLLQKKALGL